MKTIRGDWEIVRVLGEGSLGIVFLCRQRSGLEAAVKVLHPALVKDPSAVELFRNEIVRSYAVVHPNVVKSYEYFKEGDEIGMAMEYVAGGSLAELMASQPNLPIERCVRLLIDICSGLEAIHQAELLHRNLKPENILLTEDGTAKVADYSGRFYGTKKRESGGYIAAIDVVSPEYINTGAFDKRSDIYAVGCLAYELITCRLPFSANSILETMKLRLEGKAAPPGASRKECPPELDRIVLKALAVDPDNRYQSAAELERELRLLLPRLTH